MENLDINEQQVPFMNLALKTGLIIGGINIAGTLAGAITGSTVLGGILGFIIFIFSIYLIRKATIDHMKNDLGGFISFKRAYNIALVAGLVFLFLSIVFNYINLNFISPNMLDEQLAQVEQMMSKFISSDDLLEKSIEEQRASMTNPLGILKQFGAAGIFWALASLIFGAFLQKSKPFFKA